MATNAKLSAEGGKKRRMPPLPELGTDAEGNRREWHKLTRLWWRDVWRSPMAGEYLQADIHGLYRLAALVDRFWQGPDTALAAEIRLEQQCFGLTPIDRRRLQWEVARTEEATAKTKRRTAAQAEPIEDPRSVLRVLEGKG